MIWLIAGIIGAIATLFMASTKSSTAHEEQRYAKKAAARRTLQKEQQLKAHFPVRYSLLQLQKTLALRPPIWTKPQYERITTFSKDVQLLIKDNKAELLLEPYMTAMATYAAPLQKDKLLAQLTLCEQAVLLLERLQAHEPIGNYPLELQELVHFAAQYYTNEKSAR